eukprot:scaffold58829_cov30-Tisochrysis_lutea.AAC.3
MKARVGQLTSVEWSVLEARIRPPRKADGQSEQARIGREARAQGDRQERRNNRTCTGMQPGKRRFTVSPGNTPAGRNARRKTIPPLVVKRVSMIGDHPPICSSEH